MARAGAHGQIMSFPRGQLVSPECNRLRLALADGGLLVCFRAGQVLGHLRVDEAASGGDAGLGSIPCVMGSLGWCYGWIVQPWSVWELLCVGFVGFSVLPHLL